MAHDSGRQWPKKKPLLHHIGEKFEGDNHSTNHQTLCNALEPSEEKTTEEFVDIWKEGAVV